MMRALAGAMAIIDYQSYQQPLLALCQQAGREITRIYRDYQRDNTRLDIDHKLDDSPITQADRVSHHILVSGLAVLPGRYPVLSEESVMPSWTERKTWQTYWLVDPLDGTKEFIEGTGEFTINIALVHQHRPVLGMIYLPLEDCAYIGASGSGVGAPGSTIGTAPGQFAWRIQGGDKQILQPRRAAGQSALIVQTSRRHRGAALDECLHHLQNQFAEVSRQTIGSALKFCQLAEGKADIYPRYSPCSEWDTAAGQALLEAVGGGVLSFECQPLRYNEKESLLNPYFFAVADTNFDWQTVLTGSKRE